MEKILLSRLRACLKSPSLPVPVKALSSLIYASRYQHTLPKAYASSVFSLLCQKIEKMDPLEKGYKNTLLGLCRLATIRKIDDMLVFRFRDLFLKFDQKLLWFQVNSLSKFLTNYDLHDPDCLTHFNSLLFPALSSLTTPKTKPKHYISACRAFFKAESLDKQQIQLLLQKYPLFEKEMGFNQKIELFLLFRPSKDPEIPPLYASFLNQTGFFPDLASRMPEIPLNRLVLILNKCLSLRLSQPEMFKLCQNELISRKHLLSEKSLYILARSLGGSESLDPGKKSLIEALKLVFLEKQGKGALDEKRRYQQARFMLFLRNMGVISSEEVERVYLEEFVKTGDRKAIRVSLVNMINLSNQNHTKIKKFMLWTLGQLLAAADKIPGSRLYAIIETIAEFIRIPSEIALSFQLFIDNKLKNPPKSLQIPDLFSLKAFPTLLLPEESFPDPLGLNLLFKDLLSRLSKPGYEPLLLQIPLNKAVISLLDQGNKGLLADFLMKRADLYYRDEKLALIEAFYGLLTPETDFFFENQLLSEVEKLLKRLRSDEIEAELARNIERNVLRFGRSCQQAHLDYYAVNAAVEVFRKGRTLFSSQFLEKVREKVIKGDFGATEIGLNELYKIWGEKGN